MNVIKLHIKADKDQLIIQLPDAMRNQSLDITIEITDSKKQSDIPLLGLLKGKFSSQEIDDYTKNIRDEWERDF